MVRLIAVLFCLTPLPVSAAGCVVLLHGLARTDASFTILEEVLTTRGYNVINARYPSTDEPIAQLADQIVPKSYSECPTSPVHFVTHSMGGILVRHAFQEDHPSDLGHVVMLGPPNHGSELVDQLVPIELFAAMNGPAALQLGTDENSVPLSLPGVDYSVGVIAGSSSLNPLYSSMIPGPDDGKVSVASTRLEGMQDHLTLPVAHTFMMNNLQVIAQVMHFLDNGTFDHDMTWLDAVSALPLAPLEVNR